MEEGVEGSGEALQSPWKIAAADDAADVIIQDTVSSYISASHLYCFFICVPASASVPSVLFPIDLQNHQEQRVELNLAL